MDDALRQKVLGIALAFASTFFYAGMYLCIQYGGTNSALVLPLGDAGTLCNACLIYTMIFSRILLKTPITLWKTVCCVVLMAGLVMVVKPTVIFGEEIETSKYRLRALGFVVLSIK